MARKRRILHAQLLERKDKKKHRGDVNISGNDQNINNNHQGVKPVTPVEPTLNHTTVEEEHDAESCGNHKIDSSVPQTTREKSKSESKAVPQEPSEEDERTGMNSCKAASIMFNSLMKERFEELWSELNMMDFDRDVVFQQVKFLPYDSILQITAPSLIERVPCKKQKSLQQINIMDLLQLQSSGITESFDESYEDIQYDPYFETTVTTDTMCNFGNLQVALVPSQRKKKLLQTKTNKSKNGKSKHIQTSITTFTCQRQIAPESTRLRSVFTTNKKNIVQSTMDQFTIPHVKVNEQSKPGSVVERSQPMINREIIRSSQSNEKLVARIFQDSVTSKSKPYGDEFRLEIGQASCGSSLDLPLLSFDSSILALLFGI